MPPWATAVMTFMAAVLGAVAVISYNVITSAPKIEGQICSVGVGDLVNVKEGKRYTCFVALLYLTNSRKNSVHVLQYELEVDLGRGFEEVKRVYGIEELLAKEEYFKFETNEYVVQIPKVGEKLLYLQKAPIEYGTPKYGIVVFASEKDRSYFEGQIKKYRIICVDVFGHKHKIETATKEFPDIYLLSELFGLKLTEK